MKNIVLTGLCWLWCVTLYAQTITGKVYRTGTDSAVVGASVYYGGSMAGTTTSKNGEFRLLVKDKQIPIVVSCVGYYSCTVNYMPGQLLIVYLKPKTEELQSVTVVPNGMNREKEIQLFIREFIGVSEYAVNCTIANMDDIYLHYNKRTQTLMAGCDKPIIIINRTLGYTINYYLDRFELTPDGVVFAGNCRFKEETPAAAKVKRKRAEVYEGSRMQLIRALWNHTIKKTDFKLYKSNYDKLTEDSIVVADQLQQKFLCFKNRVIIECVKGRGIEVNTLTPTQACTFIDKDGYYGPGLKWTGGLSRQRIGDLLPFEYQAERETAYLAKRETGSNKEGNNRAGASLADTTSINAAKTQDEAIKLKEVNVRATKAVILMGGAFLTSWGPYQVFDISPADARYKTLLWYLLQNIKGALQSTLADTSGIVFAGRDIDKFRLIPPNIFINGYELYMEETAQAEYYRDLYFNMPIEKFKRIVFRRMVGTIHKNNMPPEKEHNIVDRYLLYLTLNDDGTKKSIAAGTNTGHN